MTAKDVEEIKYMRSKRPHWSVVLEHYLAQLAFLLVSVNSKEGTDLQFDDFLLEFDPEVEKKAQDVDMQLLAWAAANGAKIDA